MFIMAVFESKDYFHVSGLMRQIHIKWTCIPIVSLSHRDVDYNIKILDVFETITRVASTAFDCNYYQGLKAIEIHVRLKTLVIDNCQFYLKL